MADEKPNSNKLKNHLALSNGGQCTVDAHSLRLDFAENQTVIVKKNGAEISGDRSGASTMYSDPTQNLQGFVKEGVATPQSDSIAAGLVLSKLGVDCRDSTGKPVVPVFGGSALMSLATEFNPPAHAAPTPIPDFTPTQIPDTLRQAVRTPSKSGQSR